MSRFSRCAVLICPCLLLLGCSLMGAVKDRLPLPHRERGGVKFLFDAPSAKTVNLAGDFNSWGGTLIDGRLDLTIDPMQKNEKGIWEIIVPLKPGRYQYKFVIDGGVVWKHDPYNPDMVDDGYGGFNSVVVIE